jgi:hypothetical protein
MKPLPRSLHARRARQRATAKRRAAKAGRLLALPALLSIVLLASPACAHDRSTSYSSWEIRGRSARVTLRLLEIQVAGLPGIEAQPNRDAALGARFSRQLQLLSDGQPCPVTDGPRRLDAEPGRVAFEWRVTCPPQGALQVRSEVLLDVVPSHLHFARVTRDGGHPLERLLSRQARIWDLTAIAAPSAPSDPAGTSLLGYLALGVEHIVTGTDHLAFVLGLILIGGSLGEIAKVVTGFTIAHSITLVLAVLGYLRLERAPVEALIGLSIALVATENVWLLGARGRALPGFIGLLLAAMAVAAARGYGSLPAMSCAGLALFTVCYFGLLRRVGVGSSLRWCIAFIFGLIHGFAFARVLQEAGLPPYRLAAALFGFNAGVELGQLVVVAAVWPVLFFFTRGRQRAYRMVVEVGSAAIAGVGIFWFVTRLYG